jgi:hypothetical protein
MQILGEKDTGLSEKIRTPKFHSLKMGTLGIPLFLDEPPCRLRRLSCHASWDMSEAQSQLHYEQPPISTGTCAGLGHNTPASETPSFNWICFKN